MKQTKFKPNLNIIVILLLVGAIALGRNYIVNNKQAVTRSSASEEQRPLNAVTILESQNFNADPPQVQLHVQHVQMYGMLDHEPFTARPQKMVLVNKVTNSDLLELPLTPSEYPNECSTMMQEMDTFTKWNTEWFTIPELTSSDHDYTSALTDYYDVEVVYEEGTGQVYSSINPIDALCYQIPKAIPIPPTSDDGLPIE